MADEQLYKMQIIELFKHPHNKKLIEHTHTASKQNTTCGDSITLYLNIQKEIITDASFQGSGCALSTASAVLVVDSLKGMTLEQAKQIQFDTVKELLGVQLSDARIRCATLVLDALQLVTDSK
jgi:nitrogen fixation protein NifU and related proteins